MEYIREITLDMSLAEELPTVVQIKQGDSLARQILITLTDNGDPFFINDGARVLFRYRKANGVYAEKECAVNGNKVTVELTGDDTSAEGVSFCDICIIEDGMVLSSKSFYIRAYHATTD